MTQKSGVTLMLFLMLTTLVYAQGKPKLEISIQEEKVNQSMEERSGKVDIIYQPGDTIRYLVKAINTGEGLMTEPSVTDPIPLGTTFVPGSARSSTAEAKFSIDAGGEYMDWPPTYRVREANGKITVREATPDMITHIKWIINQSLESNEFTEMEFMVEVNK
ncbi:MAG: hypothetical protein K9N35_10750 [Candidatus Marinimicrobia bacterium]|nr:hypothetical protein [Candidatus Neomarinimicrobiota bacterium]